MYPIKLRDVDFRHSDYSLFTLIDKETQTDLVSDQTSDLDVELEQDENYAKLRKYCQILSESGIFNTSIRIEKVEQNKQGVLSAKSSHGTFLIGNIFRENSKNTGPTWKLDESFEKEYPNSGYIYIPCFDSDDSQEGISNNGCIFIPNKQTQITSDKGEESSSSNKQCILITNQQTAAAENIKDNESTDDNTAGTPLEEFDLDSETNKEQESPEVSLISDLNHEFFLKEKDSAHVKFLSNTKQNMSDKNSNSQQSSSPSECRSKRLNSIAQGLKDCLSSTISIIMNPICNKKSETCPESIKKEEKSNFNESKIESKHLPAIEKEGDERPKSSKEASEANIHSPNLKPSSCNIDKDSTQTIELKQAVPLINELRPSGKFGSDSPVFNSSQQLASVNLDEIVDKYSEDARNAMAKHNVDGLITLTANSSTADETSAKMEFNSKPKNSVQIRDESADDAQTQHNNIIRPVPPLMTKLMETVESTVTSLKEHLDLDRIRVGLGIRKTEAGSISSDEQIVRTVHPNPTVLSSSFIPPARSMFTSFKSTIFGFFGDREKISEPSECSSCGSTTTSSELSDEVSDSEGDPLM